MSYEEYAARVPAGKLDLVLDEEHGGVDIHLGEIADATDEWDTVLAPHMGLTEIELRDIRSNHRDNRAFQRREVLRVWKAKSGAAATYGNLMRICLKNEQKACAIVITKLFSESGAKPVHLIDLCPEDFNIGMILQLKQEEHRLHMALEIHENELIDSLTSADIVALKKNAIEHNLVPGDMVSHIMCLDPSVQWPHSLIYRFLFFCVRTSAQNPNSAVATPYNKWLSLLLSLHRPAVTQVASRVKQYLLCLEGIVSSRASPSKEGDALEPSDISLLVDALAEHSETAWKQILYSLYLFKNDAEKIKSIISLSSNPLEDLLNMWASKSFPNAKLPNLTLENLKEVLCSNIVNLSREAILLNDKLPDSKGKLNKRDISFVAQFLAIHSNKWKEIAFAFLLPDCEVDMISRLLCQNIAGVLTMWISNELRFTRPPTLQNFTMILNRKTATQVMTSLTTKGYISHKRRFSSVISKVQPAFDLNVIEGSSVLLEVQANFPTVPVTFKWHHDVKPVNEDSSLKIYIDEKYCSSRVTSFLCFFVNDIEAEGAYRCIANQHSSAEIRFQPIRFQPIIIRHVKTPLDQHQIIPTVFYSEQPEVPEDTWPPVRSNTYINLALIKQQGRSHVGKNARITIRGDVDDIYSDKENIVYEKAFRNLNAGSRLLAEGRPGSGKTTLVHKVSQDWANGKLAFPCNRLLLLVHLRAFSSDPNVGLHDILKCYYSDDTTIDVISKYVEKHNGLGLCFILDGLDEYVPDTKKAYIFRLIRKEVLPKAVVIVASRPAAAADFRSVSTRQVEVIGFLKEQIHDYIEKYPFSEDTKHAELHMYLDQHPNVHHMCYLPIHAAMVCFLFDYLEMKLPETETEIYGEFTRATVLRSLYREDKCKQQLCIESIEDLPPSKKCYYKNICKLAFETTASSKQVIKQTEVQSYFIVKEEKDSLGLITIDMMAMRCGFQNMYTFLHLTFQEFLAASYISCLVETEQLELIKTHGKEKTFQQVWKFYCGLVNFDDKGSKMKALFSESDYGSLYKVQCCFESQKPHLCDLSVDNNSLSFSDMFLSASNYTEIAFVISHTHLNSVERLSFDGCTFSEEEVDVLVKKAGDSLHRVTSLCHYKLDLEQLKVLNYFMHCLPYLEVLDISNSDIGQKEMEALSNGPNHSNLQVLKVGSRVYTSLEYDLQLKLAEIFKSRCPNFINVCFSGAGKCSSFNKPWPCSFYLWCDYPDLDLKFCDLSVPESKALSYDFILNPHYTRISLINCGIDNRAICCLILGAKSCTTLEELVLSFNSISDTGAVCIANNIKCCSRLHTLDLSFNKIANKGAIALAEACNAMQCNLFLSCNNISDFGVIFYLHKQIEFCTLRISERYLGITDCYELAHIMQFSSDCRIINTGLHLEQFQCGNLLKLDLSCNDICAKGALNLSEGLKCCTKLLTLDLSSNSLGSAGAAVIAKAVQHCTKLLEFRIASNNIGSDGARAIAEVLKHHIFLEEIGISSNNVGGDGAKSIAEGLKDCRFLQSLSISSNAIGSDGAMALAKSVKHCNKIAALDVSHNILGKDDFLALLSATEACSKLSVLNLGNTLTRYVSQAMFSEPFRFYKRIRKLNLSSNILRTKGTECVAQGLKHCSSLLELSVGSCSIGDEGAKVLANVLSEYCEGIRILDISNNSIGSEAMNYALSVIVENCTSLSELNVSSNMKLNPGNFSLRCGLNLAKLDISSNNFEIQCHCKQSGDACDCYSALFQGLKEGKNLSHLCVAGCSLLNKGVQALTSYLITHCPHICFLDLSSNGITETKVLAENLKHLSKLHTLCIRDNKIDSSGAETLVDALPHCTTLDISGNKIEVKDDKIKNLN